MNEPAANREAAAPPPAAARGDVRGLVAKWRADAAAIDEKAAERDPDGRLVWAEWMRDYMRAEASTKRGDARELESALAAEGVQAGEVEQRAREAVALALDEAGHPAEANNVRKGIDLDEYRVELSAARIALAQQPAASAVALTVCCGREECGGECGNEWRGMAMYRKPSDDLAAPPSVPVGVEADILRIVNTAIDVCDDCDRPAMAEDLEAVRLYVEQAAAARGDIPLVTNRGIY